MAKWRGDFNYGRGGGGEASNFSAVCEMLGPEIVVGMDSSLAVRGGRTVDARGIKA